MLLNSALFEIPSRGEMSDDWEEIYDEDSGQHYYFNNASNESSWEVPEGFVGAASAEQVGESASADQIEVAGEYTYI